jgi:hypothetical protein
MSILVVCRRAALTELVCIVVQAPLPSNPTKAVVFERATSLQTELFWLRAGVLRSVAMAFSQPNVVASLSNP